MAFNREDLQQLLETAEPPCVSVYLPTHRSREAARQDPIRLKNLLSEGRSQLLASGFDETFADSLLGPGRRMLTDSSAWRGQRGGLAVFLSRSGLRSVRLPRPAQEMAVVGHRFHLGPLLSLLTGDGRFWLLALSQNHVRLFEATRETVRSIDAGDIPSGLNDVVGYDWEQRELQFHGGASRGGGGRRPVVFHGHGGGDEDDVEVERFVRQVANAVERLIPDRRAPLVLAAVDELVATFRKVSRYPTLISEHVSGNPDADSGSDLHARAWPLVEPHFNDARSKAVARCAEQLGVGGAPCELEPLVVAASEGRVDTLFVADGTRRWGRFDSSSRTVTEHPEPRPGDEDLVDRAAVDTIRHSGTVYVLPHDEMPELLELAGLLRY